MSILLLILIRYSMKIKEIKDSKTILPELKLKKRTIDKENVNESFSHKQLVLKSQRMSQAKTKQTGNINGGHSRKFKSITR